MTDDQLIAEARKHAAEWERLKDGVDLAELPKVGLRDAVAISFECDKPSPRIEVILDRDTGKLIGATYIPLQKHEKA
jgi:hypothetical protein